MSEDCLSSKKNNEMSHDEKDRLLRMIEQEAHDNEVFYWGCSQAVLGALHHHLDLGEGGV